MKGIFATTSPSLGENKDDTQQTSKKTVGCMPGIFSFFHRHNHRNSRKRLTYGYNKEKRNKHSQSMPAPAPESKTRTIKASAAIPTLKRAGSADIDQMGVSPESSSSSTPRKAPALVARLMGLDDIPVSSPTLSTAEKRRKLLGALERCDEDVKILKQIIDAVRTSQLLDIVSEKKVSPAQTLLTPVSVPSAITSRAKIRRQKPISLTVMPFATTECKKTVVAKKTPAKKKFEVRMDGGMVEKRWMSWMRWEELGNVLVELEDDIFLDLMDEIVMELDLCFSKSGSKAAKAALLCSLPLDACRRRLLF